MTQLCAECGDHYKKKRVCKSFLTFLGCVQQAAGLPGVRGRAVVPPAETMVYKHLTVQ